MKEQFSVTVLHDFLLVLVPLTSWTFSFKVRKATEIFSVDGGR